MKDFDWQTAYEPIEISKINEKVDTFKLVNDKFQKAINDTLDNFITYKKKEK